MFSRILFHAEAFIDVHECRDVQFNSLCNTCNGCDYVCCGNFYCGACNQGSCIVRPSTPRLQNGFTLMVDRVRGVRAAQGEFPHPIPLSGIRSMMRRRETTLSTISRLQGLKGPSYGLLAMISFSSVCESENWC